MSKLTYFENATCLLCDEYGEVAQQIDTNTIRFQTGEYYAFLYFDINGNWVGYATNGYHKIRVSYTK